MDIPEDEKFPELGPFAYYVKCYQELSTCRISGGAIPFTSIAEFARIFNIDDTDFFDIIRMMDNSYLELSSNKDSTKTEGDNASESTSKGN